MQPPFFFFFFFVEFTDDRVKKTIDVKGVSKILTLSILKLLCFFRVSTNSKKVRITVAKSLTTLFEELLVFIKVAAIKYVLKEKLLLSNTTYQTKFLAHLHNF